MNSHKKNPFCRNLVVLTIITTIVGLLVSCPSVNHVREAQEAFSRAATIDNHNLLLGTPVRGGAVGVIETASGSYEMALRSIRKAEEENEDELIRDGLWKHVQLLKALAQWRLGLFDEALGSAETAEDLFLSTGTVGSRDHALSVALNGLVRNDQAYSKLQRIGDSPSEEEEREIIDLLTGDDGALKWIKAAQDVLPKQHPLQIYLIQSKLAALVNYSKARVIFNLTCEPNTWWDQRRKVISQLEKAFNWDGEYTHDEESIVKMWKNLLP